MEDSDEPKLTPGQKVQAIWVACFIIMVPASFIYQSCQEPVKHKSLIEEPQPEKPKKPSSGSKPGGLKDIPLRNRNKDAQSDPPPVSSDRVE